MVFVVNRLCKLIKINDLFIEEQYNLLSGKSILPTHTEAKAYHGREILFR
jgi:hypothetical protein